MPSWRDVLPIHPAAELFPLMSSEELRELGADIKANGLKNPIVLWFPDHESNKPELLDGRNRLDAMDAAGIPVVCDDWRGGGTHQLQVNWREVYAPTDPHAYVISANIRRRHLTTAQKDELIAKLLKADPKKSNRQIAKMVDRSHPHIAKVRDHLEKTGDVVTVTTSIDTKGRQQPAHKPPTKPQPAPAPAGPTARDDDGPTSVAEIARRDARIDQLQADKHRLEIENAGLRREIDKRGPVNGARAIMASREEPDDSRDFFPTPPWASRALIERVFPVLNIRLADLSRLAAWEPACGEGHMAEVLAEYFARVIATDLFDYGYGEAPVDFLDAPRCAMPIG
jgi:hypothetical protein